MLSLAQFNFVTLLVALAIGIAAGRWAFAGRRSPSDQQLKDPPQP